MLVQTLASVAGTGCTFLVFRWAAIAQIFLEETGAESKLHGRWSPFDRSGYEDKLDKLHARSTIRNAMSSPGRMKTRATKKRESVSVPISLPPRMKRFSIPPITGTSLPMFVPTEVAKYAY